MNLRVAQRIAVVLTWLLLTSLVLAAGTSVSFVVPLAIAVALVLIDLPLWRYLRGERGGWFVARSVPWHWLVYALSGGAFAWVFVRHIFSPATRLRRAIEPAR
jgi:hypothetical protein